MRWDDNRGQIGWREREHPRNFETPLLNCTVPCSHPPAWKSLTTCFLEVSPEKSITSAQPLTRRNPYCLRTPFSPSLHSSRAVCRLQLLCAIPELDKRAQLLDFDLVLVDHLLRPRYACGTVVPSLSAGGLGSAEGVASLFAYRRFRRHRRHPDRNVAILIG